MPFWLLLSAGVALLLLVAVAARLTSRSVGPAGARGGQNGALVGSRRPANPASEARSPGSRIGPESASKPILPGDVSRSGASGALAGANGTPRPGESPNRLASAGVSIGAPQGGAPGAAASAVPAASLSVVERTAAAGHVRITERMARPKPAPKPAQAAPPKKAVPGERVKLAGTRQELGRLAGPPYSPAVSALSPVLARASVPAPAAAPESEQGRNRQDTGAASDASEPGRAADRDGDRRDPDAGAIRPEPGPAPEEEPRSDPELIERTPVRYPPSAAEEGITGTTHLKIVVSPRGRVETAIVVRSSGDARLDAAAVQSALGWRYRPTVRDGQPVPSVAYAAVQFYLTEGRPRDNN
jgi:periplasmic protein TonB